MEKPVGLTRDAGWQMGVRRTVSADLETVWDFLLGEGLPLWLGQTATALSPGTTYRTADGTHGEVRSLRPHDRVRLTWQPANWDHDATLQVALTPARTGTTVVFHQERLRDAEERQAMLAHWRAVAGRVAAALTPAM